MNNILMLVLLFGVLLVVGCKNADCPEEMVELRISNRSFCIDKYENYIVAYRKDGSLYQYKPNPEYVIKKDGKYLPGNLFRPEELKDKIFARSSRGITPVDNISWIEADIACKNSNKRLCTEEEWNYACSGDKGLKYPYGDEYKEDLCSSFEYNKKIGVIAVQPSGYMPKCDNGKGVMDLSGNLWEWVADADGTKSLRVLKGGGFSNSGYDEGGLISCKSRRYQPPEIRLHGVGLRCCKDK